MKGFCFFFFLALKAADHFSQWKCCKFVFCGIISSVGEAVGLIGFKEITVDEMVCRSEHR